MKPICIILSLALLLPGCYSYAPLTKDDSPDLNNKDVIFLLTDGRSIKSSSGEHRRVENGYIVVGKLNTNQYWSDFDGMVRDEEIKSITIRKYDAIATAMGITVPIVIVAAIIVYFVDQFNTASW